MSRSAGFHLPVAADGGQSPVKSGPRPPRAAAAAAAAVAVDGCGVAVAAAPEEAAEEADGGGVRQAQAELVALHQQLHAQAEFKEWSNGGQIWSKRGQRGARQRQARFVGPHQQLHEWSNGGKKMVGTV